MPTTLYRADCIDGRTFEGQDIQQALKAGWVGNQADVGERRHDGKGPNDPFQPLEPLGGAQPIVTPDRPPGTNLPPNHPDAATATDIPPVELEKKHDGKRPGESDADYRNRMEDEHRNVQGRAPGEPTERPRK